MLIFRRNQSFGLPKTFIAISNRNADAMQTQFTRDKTQGKRYADAFIRHRRGMRVRPAAHRPTSNQLRSASVL